MRILNTLLCDDVRVEKSGKHVLVGAYLDSIQVPDFPTTLSLMLWMQFFADLDGDLPLEVRVLKDNRPLQTMDGSIHISDHNQVNTLRVPTATLELKSPGLLAFQFRQKGKRWRTVKRIPIHSGDALLAA